MIDLYYFYLNLAVHILAGLTLFGVARRTLLQARLRERFGAAANGLALATAVLWTVHPLQTESVTYIKQRCESMMALFFLLTLYCFIRGAVGQRSRLWYGLCVSACALGMACKEAMVSAPLLVLLYDCAFVSGSFRAAWQRHGRLFGALAATWLLLGCLVVFGGPLGDEAHNPQIRLSWWQYLLSEPEAILHYLRLSVWPHPLCFDYYGLTARTWSSTLPPALVIAVLVAATVWAWRANSVWGFIGGWFFLILAPTSSFLPLDNTIYEHRMYLPLAAVVAVVVVGGFELGRSLRRMPLETRVVLEWGGAGVLALVLTVLTIQRNQDYRSALTLWQDTVKKCPASARAHSGLGLALTDEGRLSEAIAQLQQALLIRPDYVPAHYNLALALEKLHRTPEAIEHYEQALRISPGFAGARNNLGVCLMDQGRLPEAVEQWEEALRLKPDYAEAHNNLGLALVQQGRLPEAIVHYEQALRIDPDNADAHNNLGIALVRLGRVQEAIGHYQQALRIKSDFAVAHNNLGLALVRAGRLEEAIGHYEQALRIDPDYAKAHNNVGAAMVQVGRVAEAISHWKQAVRIQPDYAEAHYNLGNALLLVGNAPEAIDHFEQALRIKPDFVEAQNALARARAVP